MASVPTPDSLTEWARSLEATIQRRHVRCVDRVAVVNKAGNVPHLVESIGGDRPGLMAVIGKANLGASGRADHRLDRRNQSCFVAFGLDPMLVQQGLFEIAIGLATCRVVEAAIDASSGRCGMAAPGQIVEIPPSGLASRTIAQCTFERSARCAYAYVTIHVNQTAFDWSPESGRTRASLGQLGSKWDRLQVVIELLLEVDRCVSLRDESLAGAFASRRASR